MRHEKKGRKLVATAAEMKLKAEASAYYQVGRSFDLKCEKGITISDIPGDSEIGKLLTEGKKFTVKISVEYIDQW
jgi:hypothetical protein